MSTLKPSKSSIAWKWYLVSLWTIATIFLGAIIYGLVVTQIQANQNPASGLAVAGVFAYVVYLVIYCGFIFLNTYVRKKIGQNEKASWRFLVISWVFISVLVSMVIFTMIQRAAAQDYYEKNVLPKEQACYEDYLNGKQTTPHCLR